MPLSGNTDGCGSCCYILWQDWELVFVTIASIWDQPSIELMLADSTLQLNISLLIRKILQLIWSRIKERVFCNDNSCKFRYLICIINKTASHGLGQRWGQVMADEVLYFFLDFDDVLVRLLGWIKWRRQTWKFVRRLSNNIANTVVMVDVKCTWHDWRSDICKYGLAPPPAMCPSGNLIT